MWCAVNSSGNANIANHSAVTTITTRTLYPSSTDTPSSPLVGPSPMTKPKYTITSSMTLPR